MQRIKEKLPVNGRYLLSRLLLLIVGCLISATAINIFFINADLAPTGLTGVGVILNEFVTVPVGLVFWLGNIPIQYLAYRRLSGWRTITGSLIAMTVYAIGLDVLPQLVDFGQPTDDNLLNAIFGGIAGGVGGGLVYRAGASLGGGSTLARVVRHEFGVSLAFAGLLSDAAVLLAAGIVLGWEIALYATVALFLSRTASDYVLEGSGNTHTALIVSAKSDAIAKAVKDILQHGVTSWKVKGLHHHQQYDALMITLTRTELNALRKLITLIDPDAFVTILQAQVTYGRGFSSLKPHMPLALDQVEDEQTLSISSDRVMQPDEQPPAEMPVNGSQDR